ncbi:hypothetical protein B296_00009760 [Ensete ventricosum]|uniref:Uncharacterized protein n=1 Tax=Ensete ventricosum TaxID=4639 RepID=A0A427AU29_ENSVE|nr:hypothetical protein B296_00009760 [Ensete ventricosum]
MDCHGHGSPCEEQREISTPRHFGCSLSLLRARKRRSQVEMKEELGKDMKGGKRRWKMSCCLQGRLVTGATCHSHDVDYRVSSVAPLLLRFLQSRSCYLPFVLYSLLFF